MKAPFSGFAAIAGILLMMAAMPAHASEPVLTPPSDWLESAPPGMHECKKGMTSQISHAEYRKFAARNQLWPAESKEELGDWSAWVAGSRHWKSPNAQLAAQRKIGNVRAEVVVLVGPGNTVLDKIVTCTNAARRNPAVLAAIDAMIFVPTSYKGQPLVTVMPVNFEP